MNDSFEAMQYAIFAKHSPYMYDNMLVRSNATSTINEKGKITINLNTKSRNFC